MDRNNKLKLLLHYFILDTAFFFSTAYLLAWLTCQVGRITVQGKEKKDVPKMKRAFMQYMPSELTWVMEPPLWEIEESEWILVPGMPLVILPPWTAGIAAARIKGKRSISSYNEENVNKLMPTVVSPTFFKNLLTVPFCSIIQNTEGQMEVITALNNTEFVSIGFAHMYLGSFPLFLSCSRALSD